jgi:membrane protein
VRKRKGVWALVKETVRRWSEDRAPKMAAALAFYSCFALGPLLFLAIQVAGLVFGQEAAQGQVVREIQGLVGKDSAQAIESVLTKVSEPKSGLLASIIGFAALLIGASGVFGELQDSFNIIWKVEKKPGRGIWGTLKDRFLSLSMVLGLGFLLLISLVVSAGLSALGSWIGGEDAGWLLQAGSVLFSLGVVTSIFALMFRLLPDAETRWRDTWLGGLVTAGLFTLGKFGIGLYLGQSATMSTYGAAGAFLLVLLWVYYSSQILFFGAEFTKARADLRGRVPPPDADARPVRISRRPAETRA